MNGCTCTLLLLSFLASWILLLVKKFFFVNLFENYVYTSFFFFFIDCFGMRHVFSVKGFVLSGVEDELSELISN